MSTTPSSHQTVRLGFGKHREGSDEVCVMELASMLAGEPFTDDPECACPLIAALLRAVNDALDDERRQVLLPYAAAVVGTRADEEVLRERVAVCRVVAGDDPRSGRLGRRLRRTDRPLRRRDLDAAACRLMLRIGVADDRRLRAMLDLVDTLIAIPRDRGGSARLPAAEPVPPLATA